MGISINGPSGIDTQYIIDSLVELERGKITTVEKQKKAYQLKIDGYSKLKTLLTDLGTKANGLSKLSSFDLFKTTSSNEKIATVTAGTGSVDANYDVKVFQLAGNEKMISGDKLINDQNAALSTLGVGVGTISIDGTEIEIDSEDTIQDLRQKINTSTDGEGKRLNVSASVLKIADDNYRLVFTSKKSGSAGIEYKDVSGSTLQDLGIITASGDKGTLQQKYVSDIDVGAAWGAMATGDSFTITGKDRNGTTVSAAIVKRDGATVEDLRNEISNAFNGMVEVKINEDDVDGDGTVDSVLSITDRVGGTSQMSVDNFSVGGTAVTMAVNTYGDEGAGVLSIGKDSYFSVENVYMSNSSNSATGFVSGVTFDFHALSKNESVTVTLERDGEGIRKKFQEMVDAYNAILRFSKANTKVADPNDEKSTSGNLAGDSTVRSITSQINNFFHKQFDELNTVYTSFSMVGIKTDTQSGELQIDDEKFDKALVERYDEVVNLFVTVGTSDNKNIVFGTSSPDTASGKYVFEEVDSEHFRARLEGGSTWYTSKARTGEIVSFEEGPLKGLSVTAPAGSIGAGNSATFAMSKGLSAIIDETITKLSEPRTGLVALRTESYNQSVKRTDDKIAQLEERVENYRLRLVKQFSAMEQALSQLKSQSTNMLSQIGSFSGSNN